MSDHTSQTRWIPHTYPAQTCNNYFPKTSPPTPKPDESHDLPATPATPATPALPATVRAVRDSDSSYAKSRTLIICLDGTGDKFDNDNSNVVQFVSCLKKDDPSQVTYYQSGIGTYDGQGLRGGFSAAIDMAVGSSLGVHIKDAYHFLMQNYREGDKICLLGFSRGSYTVRCLAGMLHKVGLLPRHNIAQVNFAYKFYKDDTEEGWKMSAEFKKAFCNNVDVYFVGVWDCVASVGLIPRKLPFSKTPTHSISYFRHAMALDEHRAKFKILQWAQSDPAADPNTIDNTPKAKTKAKKNSLKSSLSSCFGSKSETNDENAKYRKPSTASTDSKPLSMAKLVEEKDKQQDKRMKKFEKSDFHKHQHINTDVREVWFAGAHADVGGGAVANEERHMLSRIPLRWMIRQCFECNTGIIFGTAALAEVGIDIPTVWPVYKDVKRPFVGPSPDTVEQYEACTLPPIRRRSTALGVEGDPEKRSGPEIPSSMMLDGLENNNKWDAGFELLPEQVEDHFDAMSPINDQLEVAKGWWILEFWPVKVRVQKAPDRWEKVVRMNLGRFRAIRENEPNMHWTVQMRMTDMDYKIRNRVDVDAIWKVTS